MPRSLKIIGRNVIQSIPTMAGIVLLSFLMLKMLPGDAADALAGMTGDASKETLEALRESYGLNDSWAVQLWHYVLGLLRLDFGYSITYGAPVYDVIAQRIPSTLILSMTALVLSLIIGVTIGWIMAVFADRWPDRVLSSITLLFYSAPNFWIGLMAIVLFSAKLQWLPLGGAETIGGDLTGWAWFTDRVRHLMLPALTLSTFFVAIYARMTRASMLEIMHQDFIRTADAKGLHPVRVQLFHGLRNALIPIVTMAGMHLGNILGGAVVVETVFNWPGIGRLTMTALGGRDIDVLLGILLLTSLVVILSNILIDWLLSRIDPRISA